MKVDHARTETGLCEKCARRYARTHPNQARILTLLAESLAVAFTLGADQQQAWLDHAFDVLLREGLDPISAALTVSELYQTGLHAATQAGLRPERLERPHFTCPICERTSYNAHDVAAGYCGACHTVTRRAN